VSSISVWIVIFGVVGVVVPMPDAFLPVGQLSSAMPQSKHDVINDVSSEFN
jgi:hypothetical protein